MVHYHGSGGRCVNHIGQCEAGVVGAGIPIRGAATQPLARQRRLGFEYAGSPQPLMAPHVAEQGEGVVERERAGELPPLHASALIHRPGEFERPYEMRCQIKEASPLPARLKHEVQIAVLEVADPPVD